MIKVRNIQRLLLTYFLSLKSSPFALFYRYLTCYLEKKKNRETKKIEKL